MDQLRIVRGGSVPMEQFSSDKREEIRKIEEENDRRLIRWVGKVGTGMGLLILQSLLDSPVLGAFTVGIAITLLLQGLSGMFKWQRRQERLEDRIQALKGRRYW